jgi:hypothetical protein
LCFYLSACGTYLLKQQKFNDSLMATGTGERQCGVIIIGGLAINIRSFGD